MSVSRLETPVFDGRAEFAADAEELLRAAQRVLESGVYILGPEVEAFENEVAEYLGSACAVGCASGTDALWLGLRALGVGPGDAVIAPAFTFFATVSAILGVGATPVICDIDFDTLSLDPESLSAVIECTPHRDKLKAIVPVHLFGQPADMDAVSKIASEHELFVLEDAAQAFGSSFQDRPAGMLGDAGAFSFFPTKNLGGFGDGGMVVSDDPEIGDRVRLLRAHGSRERYRHDAPGANSRLDELQAALLRVRLRGTEGRLAARRALACAYDRVLEDSSVVRPARIDGREHSFNLYVIRLAHGRDAIAKALRDRGVATAVHYPSPIHIQKALAHLGHVEGDFPRAEEACKQVLTLPLYPTLGEARAKEIGKLVATTYTETT